MQPVLSSTLWQVLQSNQIKRTAKDSTGKSFIWKLNPYVVFRLQIHSCIGNGSWIHTQASSEISACSIFLNLIIDVFKAISSFRTLFNLTECWEFAAKNSLLITHAEMQIWIWKPLRERLTDSSFICTIHEWNLRGYAWPGLTLKSSARDSERRARRGKRDHL